MSTLDVLFDARERLVVGERWKFSEWRYCACGHVYAAATGGELKADGSAALAVSRGYRRAIREIARALGWRRGTGFTPTRYVSWLTYKRGATREAGIAVFDDAIRALGGGDELARRQVLAQTEEIVEAAARGIDSKPAPPPRAVDWQTGYYIDLTSRHVGAGSR